MYRPHHLAVITLIFVLTAGCIGGGGDGQQQQRQYVTPCPIINEGIQIRIVGDSLSSEAIEDKLAGSFIDDLSAQWAQDNRQTLTVDCYWGKKEGQRRDYYYCEGKYVAPELTEEGVIKRQLWKYYIVGFDVEKHEVGTWTDLSGEKHSEESYYYLTVKDVKTWCWIADSSAVSGED